MKVVYLSRGLGDYVSELVNAMSQYVEAHIVLPRKDELISNCLKSNVKIFKSYAPRNKNPGNLLALFKTANYIKSVSPDIIHIQSGVIWELPLKKIFKHIPFVITSHDLKNHPSHTKLVFTPQIFLNRALLIADAIIVHSRRLRNLAMNNYHKYIKSKPVFIVPIGIISRYGTGISSVEPQKANILLFGAIDSWKGIEYLVFAEPKIREYLPEVKIVIAGNCSDVSYYKSLVSCAQQIEIRPYWQNENEVKELFSWADVLVLPYIQASQSAVLQLGFSFGVPSIVTNVGGLPDVIQDGINGLIVPPRDSEALAEAVIRLVSDLALRKKIIHNILECRDTIYNWENIAKQYLEIYNSLLKPKNI